MKKLLIGLVMLIACMKGYSQSSMIGKLRAELDTVKQDTSRAILLYQLSYYYQSYKPDSALYLAQTSYDLSTELGFIRGRAASLGQMARAFNNIGNFSKALEYYLEQLKLIEKQKDPENIGSAYINIALVYSGRNDITNALLYAHKADELARANNLAELRLYTTLDLGDIYRKNNQLDSALHYTLMSYNESLDPKNDSLPRKDIITGTAMNNLGNIYFKKDQFDIAIESYEKSIPYLESMQDENTLSECYLGLARVFEKLGRTDSALYYGRKSFRLASDNEFLQHSLSASEFLSGLYKQNKNIDSAFAYQGVYLALKDSFNSAEKIKDLQNHTITEQMRQEEIAKSKRLLAKERRLKLELLLVGLFIPVFFLLSAYMSRKKVSKRVIEVSGIISLLFLFEYITLLIHPVVQQKSGHSPLIEIFIFVALAAILSPLHHNVEHRLIARLTKKHPPAVLAGKQKKKIR